MYRFLSVILSLMLLLAGCTPAPSPQLTVKLSSPESGTVVPSLSPVLVWGSAGATTFRLLIATDSNFQRIVMDSSNVGEAHYSVPSDMLSGDTTYYWRVIASKGNASSEWSAPWSFHTPKGGTPSQRGAIKVSATIDGIPWSGSVNYTISGPVSDTDNSLPWSFNDLPVGTYTLTYNYGGPSGATLASITSSPSQELSGGGTLYFTLNFHKQSASSVIVNATLNGMPWAGAVSYSLAGTYNVSDTSLPRSYNTMPAGTYTLTYKSGGPGNAVLSSITPAYTQTLSANGSIVFTLNFSTQQTTGNIVINAYVNGSPWSGGISYSINGPFQTSGGTIPRTCSSVPVGTYSFTYAGGGPSGATLANITPGITQVLTANRTIVFNLNFVTQPSTGTIIVNAQLDGQPWKTAVGSGAITYALSGPTSNSGDTIPGQFSNMSAGAYTLTYHGGGPIGATLTSISPSPLQNLSSGGTIVFTLNFTGQPKGTVIVNATFNGSPWSGQVGYTLTGPYVDSGYSVSHNFSGAPAGSYTVHYTVGGPPGSRMETISPPTQILPAGGTAVFTLVFTYIPGPMPGPVPTPGPMPGPIPTPTPTPHPGPLPGPLLK